MLQWFAEVKEPPPWPVVDSVGERGGAGGVAGWRHDAGGRAGESSQRLKVTIRDDF